MYGPHAHFRPGIHTVLAKIAWIAWIQFEKRVTVFTLFANFTDCVILLNVNQRRILQNEFKMYEWWIS